MHVTDNAMTTKHPADTPAMRGGKLRLVTVQSLDGRTRAARRSRELAAAFVAELGGILKAAQQAEVERAATLTALAEDARARCLAGDATVRFDDVVRIDGAAARAVRALGLKQGAPPQKGPTLAEHLARRAAERAGASSAGEAS